jgi:hypothetical protein
MHPQDRLFCEIAVQLNLLTREQVARCLKAQQHDASKNVASLAVAQGFMNAAAVENVLQQQQRLLERRREARNASVVQREAESRASAGGTSGSHPAHQATGPEAGRMSQPHPPSSASGVGKPPRRDPTPTARWTSEAPAHNRLRASESPLFADDYDVFSGHPELDAASVHETLDTRAPARRERAARPTQPLPNARESSPGPFGLGASLPPPAAQPGPGLPPMAARKLPDFSPPPTGRTQPPAELRLKKLYLV